MEDKYILDIFEENINGQIVYITKIIPDNTYIVEPYIDILEDKLSEILNKKYPNLDFKNYKINKSYSNKLGKKIEVIFFSKKNK